MLAAEGLRARRTDTATTPGGAEAQRDWRPSVDPAAYPLIIALVVLGVSFPIFRSLNVLPGFDLETYIPLGARGGVTTTARALTLAGIAVAFAVCAVALVVVIAV